MNRRSLLGSILAAGVAPVFVGANVLMPVRRIIVPAPDWTALAKIGVRMLHTQNGPVLLWLDEDHSPPTMWAYRPIGL